MYWLATNNHLEELAEELRGRGCPEYRIGPWMVLAQSQGQRALHPSQLPA
jgi:hypothetical protein